MNYKERTKKILQERERVAKVSLSKKWYGMLIDTETLNDDKLIIEIGLVVVNNNLVKQEKYNVIVKEVWENKEMLLNPIQSPVLPNDKATTTNYALEKIALWEQRIEKGELQVKSIWEITKDLNNMIRKYDMKYFIAYNAGFDKQAITNTNKIFNVKYSKIEYLKIIDIWYLTNVITTTREYTKWCFKNNYLTDNGNPKTSAEIVYRWLSYQNGFIETHHAIDDMEIELEILQAIKTKTSLISGLKNMFCYYNLQQKKYYKKSKES